MNKKLPETKHNDGYLSLEMGFAAILTLVLLIASSLMVWGFSVVTFDPVSVSSIVLVLGSLALFTAFSFYFKYTKAIFLRIKQPQP